MMAIGQALRMAGPKLFNFLKGDLSRADIIGRLVPEAAIAGLYTTMSPGTPAEKAVEFVTDVGLSGLTGLAAGGAARKLGANRDISGLADNIGSIAGGFAAWPASELAVRGLDKLTGGPGMTSYEKLGQKERQEYEKQLREQILSQYGLISGINPQQYGGDSYLAQLGLG